MSEIKSNRPLLVLAIGAFGIGVTEFAPMGMLPAIARGLDVSIPSAGLLVSAYAIGVMIGAYHDTPAFAVRQTDSIDRLDEHLHRWKCHVGGCP